MTADHDHKWTWDHEEPPGYFCTVGECAARSLACENCEEPSTGRFCSKLCEAEYEFDHKEGIHDDEDNDDPFDDYPYEEQLEDEAKIAAARGEKGVDDLLADDKTIDELLAMGDMPVASESVIAKLKEHRIGKLADLLKSQVLRPKEWNEPRQRRCYMPHTVELQPGVHDVESYPMTWHFTLEHLVFAPTDPPGVVELHHPDIVIGKAPTIMFTNDDYSVHMQREIFRQVSRRIGQTFTFKLENTTDKPVTVRYCIAGVVDFKPDPIPEGVVPGRECPLPEGLYLVDVEQRAARHKDSFEIPTREERLALVPGQSAKLVFCRRDAHEEIFPAHPGAGERMWVDVVARYINADWRTIFTGRLSAHPVVMTELKHGDLLTFGAEHIASIHKPQEDQ